MLAQFVILNRNCLYTISNENIKYENWKESNRILKMEFSENELKKGRGSSLSPSTQA